MKRFVAVYDEAAVRDTQICKEDPNSVSPEMDDVWGGLAQRSRVHWFVRGCG